MKFTVASFLTALLAFAGSLFFPWWIIAVTSFIVGVLIHQRAAWAYLSGFAGVSLLWGTEAIIINVLNHQVLATRIASVLPLGGSPVILVIVSSLVGGLVGGFAAMTGSFLRRPVISRSNKRDRVVTAG